MKTGVFLIAALPPSLGLDYPHCRLHTTRPEQPVNRQPNPEKQTVTDSLLGDTKPG
jgi:hypothetical protein